MAGAYDSHYVSRGAAIGAGGLAIGAVLAAGATDGGDAAEVDSARLMEQWSKASFKSIEESLIYHFGEHGEEVGANSILQYMRKAEAFNQNLRGASKSIMDDAIRYSKQGKYIIKDFEGKIRSFGNIRYDE